MSLQRIDQRESLRLRAALPCALLPVDQPHTIDQVIGSFGGNTAYERRQRALDEQLDALLETQEPSPLLSAVRLLREQVQLLRGELAEQLRTGSIEWQVRSMVLALDGLSIETTRAANSPFLNVLLKLPQAGTLALCLERSARSNTNGQWGGRIVAIDPQLAPAYRRYLLTTEA